MVAALRRLTPVEDIFWQADPEDDYSWWMWITALRGLSLLKSGGSQNSKVTTDNRAGRAIRFVAPQSEPVEVV